MQNPAARNIGNIGGRDWRHRAARMRRARLTMIVDATNDYTQPHAPAYAVTRTG